MGCGSLCDGRETEVREMSVLVSEPGLALLSTITSTVRGGEEGR